MRDLGFDLWLDDATGMSYFSDAEGIKTATGYTFEATPQYPWPLSMTMNKNAGQFASKATADAIMVELNKNLKEYIFEAGAEPETRLGPFRWLRPREFQVSDTQGVVGFLNAGGVAQEFIRQHAQTAIASVQADVRRLATARDRRLWND